MSILSQEFIFSAFGAEKDGDLFPIDFDDVWETLGYSRKSDARRYLLTRSGLKRFTDKGLRQLPLSYLVEQSDKIKLSTDSYKFALARASTKEGEQYLIQLIQIEKQYRQYLENLFNAEPSDRDLLINTLNNTESEILILQQKLEQSQLDHQNFCFSSKFLHQVSGIVNYCQIKNAILRDFVEGRDWVIVDKDVYLNESTFNILVTSFRSARGTDIDRLPEIIKLETNLYFQYQELRRKNRRVGQNWKDIPGQQSLFEV